MTDSSQNLFLRLSRWATRQGENFLTESFALVLSSLVQQEPQVGGRVLGRLTGWGLQLPPEDLAEVSVRTQITTEAGRPDLEIRTRDRLAHIEVKDEADLGDLQLERYRSTLDGAGVAETCLVLLARYVPGDQVLGRTSAVFVRWLEVAEWLESELEANAIQREPARFLVEQFLGFLRARGLAMQRVESGLVDGVRSLRALCEMLSEAVGRCAVSFQRVAGWEYIGLNMDQGRFFVGMRFDGPDVIFQTTQYGINAEAASSLQLGEVFKSQWPTWSRGPFRWRNMLDLSADDGQFFRLSKSEQLERLTVFIRDSLAAARRIGRPEPSAGQASAGEQS